MFIGHLTVMQVSFSESIGSSVIHAAVTFSLNSMLLLSSKSTTLPEYKNCLNFVWNKMKIGMKLEPIWLVMHRVQLPVDIYKCV